MWPSGEDHAILYIFEVEMNSKFPKWRSVEAYKYFLGSGVIRVIGIA